ncbi:MAG: 50S ribosomal protein L22 [Candidatus Magasanikbacteria bacterium CG_4_10_14_0_8_um_filter_32_14]|uniref:Large ribosomal subunit protein uL22 n=1 Tax=Candidatus Magasanikbacteria bacterium CG_4_10_14_0_8_um_filter_32_14 TaxID=1974640 RepID=A0A2M7R927_9BACT|nr:MAG: 50S ribosomal protein L22 [Candidatus Magasanikbacteria bacterium CG_4_10_14_0_8_um_filter_32_14]
MKVQTKAQLRFLRMSPQKVRLVAGLVRGMKVKNALDQLQFNSKQAALPVKKLIESAVANAIHNDQVKVDTLKIETIFVNEGSVLHRWMPRAMGRATPLRKRSSHVTVILTGEVDETKKKTEKKEVKEAKIEEIKKEITKKTKSASAKATADKK